MPILNFVASDDRSQMPNTHRPRCIIVTLVVFTQDEVDNEEFLALHHYYNEAVAQLGLLSDRARPPTSLQAQRQQEATERVHSCL